MGERAARTTAHALKRVTSWLLYNMEKAARQDPSTQPITNNWDALPERGHVEVL